MKQFHWFRCGRTDKWEEEDTAHTIYMDGVCGECAEKEEEAPTTDRQEVKDAE